MRYGYNALMGKKGDLVVLGQDLLNVDVKEVANTGTLSQPKSAWGTTQLSQAGHLRSAMNQSACLLEKLHEARHD